MMVNVMVLGHVASSKANDLKICFVKLWSLFKTSDKNLWAKKVLLRQKRFK